MATVIDHEGNLLIITGSANPGLVEVGGQYLRVEQCNEEPFHRVGMRTSRSPRAALEKITRVIDGREIVEIMRQGQIHPTGSIEAYFVVDRK